MYSDTLLASVKSIRGYKSFQIFAIKNFKFDRLALMQKESSAPEACKDCIRDVGAPNKTVTDNDQILTGTKWTNINRRYCIIIDITVPKNQHQNYCENFDGDFKFVALKLFHNNSYAPTSYWCYAASFLDKTYRYISDPSIGNRFGYEVIKGGMVVSVSSGSIGLNQFGSITHNHLFLKTKWN